MPPHILVSLQVACVYWDNTITTKDIKEVLQEAVSILYMSSIKQQGFPI